MFMKSWYYCVLCAIFSNLQCLQIMWASNIKHHLHASSIYRVGGWNIVDVDFSFGVVFKAICTIMSFEKPEMLFSNARIKGFLPIFSVWFNFLNKSKLFLHLFISLKILNYTNEKNYIFFQTIAKYFSTNFYLKT